MLGIGWPELLIIAVVTVIAVGPQELPKVLRTVMLWTRKLRKLAAEFQAGMEDLAREAELHELTKDIEKEVTASVEKDMAEMEREVSGTLDASGIEKEVAATNEELAATNKELGGTFRVYDQYDELLDPTLVAGTAVYVPTKPAVKEPAPEASATATTPAADTARPSATVQVAETERVVPEPVPAPVAKPRIDA